jgi:hypothetical protein
MTEPKPEPPWEEACPVITWMAIVGTCLILALDYALKFNLIDLQPPP